MIEYMKLDKTKNKVVRTNSAEKVLIQKLFLANFMVPTYNTYL